MYYDRALSQKTLVNCNLTPLKLTLYVLFRVGRVLALGITVGDDIGNLCGFQCRGGCGESAQHRCIRTQHPAIQNWRHRSFLNINREKYS